MAAEWCLAGQGCFNIEVKGASGRLFLVMPPRLRMALRIGTLTFSRAKYQSSGYGVNYNAVKDAKRRPRIEPNIVVSANGDDSSTTKSAISPGTIKYKPEGLNVMLV